MYDGRLEEPSKKLVCNGRGFDVFFGEFENGFVGRILWKAKLRTATAGKRLIPQGTRAKFSCGFE